MCCCCCLLTSVMSDSLQPYGLWPSRLLCPWNFPGQNTGVGCHVLLQGIFPTQGSNPGLLHCWQIRYHLATREAPYKVRLCLLWADSYIISISAIQYKPHLFFAQETEIKPLTVQANVYFLLHLSKRQCVWAPGAFRLLGSFVQTPILVPACTSVRKADAANRDKIQNTVYFG